MVHTLFTPRCTTNFTIRQMPMTHNPFTTSTMFHKTSPTRSKTIATRMGLHFRTNILRPRCSEQDTRVFGPHRRRPTPTLDIMYSQIVKHQRHHRRFGRDPTLHSDESVFKAVPRLNMCHVFEYKLCSFKQKMLFVLSIATAIVTLLWSVQVYASTTAPLSYVLGVLFVLCWTSLAAVFSWRECHRGSDRHRGALSGALTHPTGMTGP